MRLHKRADMQLLFVMVMRKRVKVKTYSYSVHAAKACKGSGSVAPLILYLGTRGKWMVTVTSLPLYPCEITPVIMKYGAQWAPGRFWIFCKTEKFVGLTGIRPPDRRVRSLFATPTAVSQMFVLTKINFWRTNPPPHFCLSCLSIAFITVSCHTFLWSSDFSKGPILRRLAHPVFSLGV
jgi:hypothetical protein